MFHAYEMVHNGTVTVDPDKKRLIEIPPNGCKPPMRDWQGFLKHLKCNHRKQRREHALACEQCTHKRHMSDPWPLLPNL